MKKFAIITIVILTLCIPIGLANESETRGGQIGCYKTENEEWKCPPINEPIMDVVIVLDSTGSMSDEITLIKSSLRDIIQNIRNGNPRPDIRVGIVTYRDHPPEDDTYVYKKIDLTSDVNYIVDELMRIKARGGGDGPEAVADALHVAINDMNWRGTYECGPNEPCPLTTIEPTKKIIFLVGDAPPHGYNQDQGYLQFYDYKKEIEVANRKDITIYTMGASGIRSYTHGVDIFKEIAEETGGIYEELQYYEEQAEDYYIRAEVTEEARKIIESDSTVYDITTGMVETNNAPTIMGEALRAESISMGVEYESEHDVEIIEPFIISDPEKEDDELLITPKPENLDIFTQVWNFLKQAFGF